MMSSDGRLNRSLPRIFLAAFTHPAAAPVRNSLAGLLTDLNASLHVELSSDQTLLRCRPPLATGEGRGGGQVARR
jgi:hypothetical protein